MKKVSLILAFSFLSSLTFAMPKEDVKHYRVKCGNIWYYFDCSCGLAGAQVVGQAICDAYGVY